MNCKGFRFVLVFATVLWVVGLTSCAHEQQLTSITVQPTTETFGAADIPVSADAGLNVQLRALGSFIHPPVTKDITDQVLDVILYERGRELLDGGGELLVQEKCMNCKGL